MRIQAILRREWFGGLLAIDAAGYPAILDPEGFQRTQREWRTRDDGHGLLREVDAERLGFSIRHDALSTPGAIYAELTRRCDGACSHCFAAATPTGMPGELSFQEWRRVFLRLGEGGAYYARLTGGEPTLREDLLDLLDVLADLGMAVGLNTHGRFGANLLGALIQHGARDLRVSVDGIEPVHDSIRGRGTFRQAVETLRCVTHHNRSSQDTVQATLNVVLMKPTRSSIQPLMQLAVDLGCKISFGLLRPAGRAASELMLSPHEVLEAAKTVAREREVLQMRQGQARISFDVACDEHAPPLSQRPFPFDDSKCPIGAIGLGIMADGRVTPCNYLGHMNGGEWLGENVRDHDVLQLWHGSPVLLQARQVRRRGCEDCRHHTIRCNGGCPASAYAVTHELDGPDPYCVRSVNETKANLPPQNPRPSAYSCRPRASALLRAIRQLGVYSPAEWDEYQSAFQREESVTSTDTPSLQDEGPDLAQRIRAQRGAEPVAADSTLSAKILTVPELLLRRPANGWTLGIVSGAYDLLHRGHIDLFAAAKARIQGLPNPTLCALVLSDHAIRQKKGPARPVLNLNERLVLISAVRCIDFVIPLEEPDARRAITTLKPSLFFKRVADLSQEVVREELHLTARGGGSVEMLPEPQKPSLNTTQMISIITGRPHA